MGDLSGQMISGGSSSIVDVCETFAKFCVLIAKPENQIKLRSGQYIEVPAYTRTIADMNNEMAQKLTELPKYTAYAKVLQNGTIRKGKTRTIALGGRSA